MTDYMFRADDRAFVFGGTSIFQYELEVDDNDNELLDVTKVWHGSYLSEKNKDVFRESLKNSTGKVSKGKTTGNDYMILRGDRIFVFGDVGMFEYRWNMVGGNELLELHKQWKASDLSEEIKDKLRGTLKEKATGISEVEASKPSVSQLGVDAILDDGKAK